jgi:hypothetical protein
MPFGDLTSDVVIPAGISTATSTVEEWVMDNWFLIVAVVMAAIILPPLIKKI